MNWRIVIQYLSACCVGVFLAGPACSASNLSDYYFIAANPAPLPESYASALYRLSSDGQSLDLVRTITTRRQGAELVRVYDDAGLIVLSSAGGPHRVQFDVVHMDDPIRLHQLEAETADKDVIPGMALIESPDAGLILGLQRISGGSSASDPVRAETRGLSLDGGSATLNWEAYANLISSGFVLGSTSPGVFSGYVATYGVIDGKFRLGYPGGTTQPAFAAPDLSGLQQKNGLVEIVNNSAIRLLSSYELIHGEDADRTTDYLIYHKANAAWSRVSVPGTQNSTSAFGAYLAFVSGYDADEYSGKRWPKSRQSNEYYASLADRLPGIERSGHIVLINTTDKHRVEFDVDSADVDVLHVDQEDVLYRVGPTLFVRRWSGKQLDEPRRLSTNHAIAPSIHWAFQSRKKAHGTH